MVSRQRMWNEKIGREQDASAIVVRDHVWFVSETGVMTVIKPGPEFNVVARNDLGEEVHASPAITRGQWLIRGLEHLYCIGKP